MTSHSDRELMQMALDALDWKLTTLLKKSWENHHIHEVVKALRDRLAQPKYEFECPRCGHCCQQREWVGLTDDEITMRWSWSQSREAEETATTQQHAFAYAIEAKLKEKNT